MGSRTMRSWRDAAVKPRDRGVEERESSRIGAGSRPLFGRCTSATQIGQAERRRCRRHRGATIRLQSSALRLLIPFCRSCPAAGSIATANTAATAEATRRPAAEDQRTSEGTGIQQELRHRPAQNHPCPVLVPERPRSRSHCATRAGDSCVVVVPLSASPIRRVREACAHRTAEVRSTDLWATPAAADVGTLRRREAGRGKSGERGEGWEEGNKEDISRVRRGWTVGQRETM